jgi:hypothetical protein
MIKSCEAVWLGRMCVDLQVTQVDPTTLHCGNQSNSKVGKESFSHKQTKHVEVHCHYIRQLVKNEKIELLYLCNQEQTPYIFAYHLDPDKYVHFRDKLGVISIPSYDH